MVRVLGRGRSLGEGDGRGRSLGEGATRRLGRGRSLGEGVGKGEEPRLRCPVLYKMSYKL